MLTILVKNNGDKKNCTRVALCNMVYFELKLFGFFGWIECVIDINVVLEIV